MQGMHAVQTRATRTDLLQSSSAPLPKYVGWVHARLGHKLD